MDNSSTKVLFVAYDFPPCNSIGGSIRSEKFVKYLPDTGWQASVLSLQEAETKNKAENYQNVFRFSSFTPWRKPYDVVAYGWAWALYAQAKQILQDTQHQLIYVSCPPFPQTLTALLLKRRHYNIPVVVDFRDAWSLDPYVEGSRLKKILYKWVFPHIEKVIISGVDCLIFNTPSTLLAYQEKYPQHKSKMHCLANGFDEADFVDYKPSGSKADLHVLYAGRFGVGGRNPELVIKAIKILIDEGVAIRFTFVGEDSPILRQLVEKQQLSAVVEIKGLVPHSEAVQMMARADALFLYQEQSASKVSSVAGKTYEYLRAGKPIIAVCPAGDNARMIEQYSPLYKMTNEHCSNKIADIMREMRQAQLNNQLPTYSKPLMNFNLDYNRQALAKKLADIFDSLAAVGRT